MSLLSRIFLLAKNKTVFYLASRYITLFIQFLNSLLIGVVLGPFYLGIWGGIQLVLQYMQQCNFGVASSTSILLSLDPSNTQKNSKIYSNALVLLILLSVLLGVIIYFFLSHDGLLPQEYEISRYSVYLITLGGTTFIAQLMSNVFRVYGKIFEIVLFQSLYPILMLICLICNSFFKADLLIDILLVLNVICIATSLTVFFLKSPLRFSFSIDHRTICFLLKKSFYLFLYLSSLYLVTLSVRTFVGKVSSISEFGIFTFASTISTACLMLFDSLGYLVFPKMINRFSKLNLDENYHKIVYFRDIYLTSIFITVLTIVIFYPIITLLLPKFSNSYQFFLSVSALTLFQALPFGLVTYLLSIHDERYISFLAFLSFSFSFLILYYGVFICKIAPHLIPLLAIPGSLLFYLGILTRLRFKHLSNSFLTFLSKSFPHRVFIPLTAYLLMIVFMPPWWSYIILLGCIYFLNHGIILGMRNLIHKLETASNLFA